MTTSFKVASGTLLKQSSSGLFWNQRHFVLTQRELYYHDGGAFAFTAPATSSGGQPRGVAELAGARVTNTKSTRSGKFAFKLVHRKGKWVLSGATLAETLEWVAALQSVDLGALHRALEGSGPVSLEALEAAVKQLLPAADVPPKEVLAALFRAWDTDNSGYIERGELVAGCQALCGGDETDKLRLTFSCFDADGDAHLSKEEVRAAPRRAAPPLHLRGISPPSPLHLAAPPPCLASGEAPPQGLDLFGCIRAALGPRVCGRGRERGGDGGGG